MAHSKQLFARIDRHNSTVSSEGGPLIETAPLPAGAQFLNVIESVFSGMARAIIHNSDYGSMDIAKAAIDRYFGDRNAYSPAMSAVWSLSGEGGRSRVSSATRLIVVSFPPKLHVLRSLANTAH
jgi:hypothetical protein